ncbi:Hypothetical_protein [Hexamita inflata]|uniref:Hypothetical_protein n=1 Tax=Hexamita inflata TaxID=28002 RepID=A0AA86NX78_9EUKA|nr:Hypothetical protein HINF_LOCUS15942 [Hexamita inflata]
MEFHVPNQIQLTSSNARFFAQIRVWPYLKPQFILCQKFQSVSRGLQDFTCTLNFNDLGERRKSSLNCHLTQNRRATHIVKSQSEMKVHVSNQICADFVLSTAGCNRKTLAGVGEF